jgi:hypothetical protein
MKVSGVYVPVSIARITSGQRLIKRHNGLKGGNQMTSDLRVMQYEALRRIADVIEEVQGSLQNAQDLMMEKFFSETDPEPVFVFRAQDALVMSGITAYYSKCLIAGLKEHAAEVNKAMQEIREWQRRHPDRVKLPDHKHQPAITGTPEFTGNHAAVPKTCSHCPNPNSPDPTYHQTGAAHIVRVGPNSFAMDSRAYPVRPIRDNPQA